MNAFAVSCLGLCSRVWAAVACVLVLERFDSVRCFQRDGDPVREYLAANPVHHRRQIHEAMHHRNIGCTQRPQLVGPLDLHAPQQIRPDLVLAAVTVNKSNTAFGRLSSFNSAYR